MIDDEATARRLANAILADLVLYNDARIRAATNVRIALAREISEARDLFQRGLRSANTHRMLRCDI